MDALDVGFRIKERHAIEKLNFFVPAKIEAANVVDLSQVLKDQKTLSAVFNESLRIGRETNDAFAALKSNSSVSLYVMKLDMQSDVEIRHIYDGDKTAGSILQFKESIFNKMSQVGDYYIRIRLLLSGQLRQLFVSNFKQADRIFVSSFYTTDMIEFRLNERRTFPAGLLQAYPMMRWPKLSAIYFILIRDFRAELVRSHTGFHKIRRLEKHLWSSYLASLSKKAPQQMMLYHWRVKASTENIDDFTAFASFRTINHLIPLYIFAIVLIGMAATAFEAEIYAYLSPSGPDCAAQTNWNHLKIGIAALTLLSLPTLVSLAKKLFRFMIRRGIHIVGGSCQ
ncbi:hypothetical protein IYW40_11085 [Methylocystis sp. H4A]|uniref:hypothetical protein n=1 Tax=Methylocystis sp. H4A TaxID=2785788 RepID=UPI0018C31769|nr:hypothetical protein [Methylocystis sp. H4A]MBG0801485.1 hypothetical protein [Methylocystis sp. H4A]MBG0802017.1 hypothetical protein [Methylocystis sp. H4A]